jgi:hypothetical protein
LAAVNWAENTIVRGKKPGEPMCPMKPYEAAKRLKITQTMLKSWLKNRSKIAAQKKHSRRAACLKLRAREPDMEHALFQKFQEARKLGKGIGCQWFKRQAKILYREQYPQRVV